MMTKDQEREVLNKIKALIDSTGSDSYIEAAFAGCVEIAADNIDNDFMTSLKDRSEEANKREAAAKLELQEQKDLNKDLQNRIEELEKKIDAEKEAKETALNNAIALTDQLYSEKDNVNGLERQIEGLEDEIIRLKAKLYDLMTA